MTLSRRIIQSLLVVATGAVFAATAMAQVTTRLTVPGGAATSTKITPGSPVSFDVRVDTTVVTIGPAYFIRQSTPAGAPFPFQITNRSLVGVPYDDVGSEQPLATIIAVPAALLAPATTVNLGSTKLAGVAAGANILVSTITLSSDPAAPLGVYVVKPDPGNAFMTDAAFNDYDMSGATFNVTIGQTLTVNVVGAGTVTADSGLINCPGVCSDIYPGTTVNLTATPTAPATFTGWSGACSGTGACAVTVDAAKNVTATFSVPQGTYTAAIGGPGTGTVAGTGGVSCPGTCTSAPLNYGTVVTVTATPTGGSTFNSWSGGTCSGATNPCTFTVNSPTATVTANFDVSFPLTVTKTGNGSGTVTSAPAGIACGATCVASFAAGTVVTLTAVADPGKNFVTFSGGGCTTSPCNVTVSAATTVTAQFTDTTAPTTTILTMPSDPSSVANPVFTFSANEPGSTFQCSLDGAPFTACSSPTSVLVGNGSHTFQVRATDPAGNVGAPASFTWLAAGIVAAPTVIPTLSEWMLALLALMLGTMGYLAMRRRS
jgi:hypothetical protein